MGQVTHALLTRPPLSHRIFIPEGNQIKCFVRLACVKHAASVHPEPGSNSHVMKWIPKEFTSPCHFREAELLCDTARYSFKTLHFIKMTSLCEPIRVADFKCEHIPFFNGLPSSFEYPVQLNWLFIQTESEFTVLRLLHFWSVLELFSKSFKVFHCSVINVRCFVVNRDNFLSISAIQLFVNNFFNFLNFIF